MSLRAQNSEGRRILLIEPPFYRLYHNHYSLIKHPLALGYLAGAVLKRTDWQCQTYNADFNPRWNITVGTGYVMGPGFRRYLEQLSDHRAKIWNEIREAIAEFDPDVVGITAKTQTFAGAAVVARLVKEHDPRVPVALGGPHATLSPEHALRCTEIDILAVGEGERTLVELLQSLEEGTSLHGVPGLVFRQRGATVRTPARVQIEDLDVLPHPITVIPKVLRDYERYPPDAFGFVFSARGCPYSCTFCESKAMWTQKTRWRSPENVVEELELLQQAGVQRVVFDDDTFGIKQSYIMELCALIERRCPDLRWNCEITVGVTRDASIKAMKRAGCVSVAVGVESGNNEMLRKIRKSQTIEKAYEAVDTIKANGIEAQTFFMLGFPEETEETLADTVEAIRRINSDFIILNVFTPYPGSEMFAQCRQLGLVDDDFDVARHNHHSPENCFTALIAPERFRILVRRVSRMVDRRNRICNVRRALIGLRSFGLRHTLRRSARSVLGDLSTRLALMTSNAFYYRD